MKKLSDILYKVRLQSVNGSTDILINDIQIDSRKVSGGSVFIAIKGEKANGHDFIDKAIGLFSDCLRSNAFALPGGHYLYPGKQFIRSRWLYGA